MRYSPLAVHCTSLCLDVIQSYSFRRITHNDIDGFKDDIYLMICTRSSLMPNRHICEHQFASHVTDGILTVLHQCLNNPNARDSVWILAALESRIAYSINTILH
jgi:hypothetical protein